MPTIAEDFDANWKADEKGCWIWQRATGSHGYGVVSVSGKLMLAHRFSYERAKGKIPRGLQACHSCDVRPCVNPAHLFAGTDRENKQDALRKGKGRRGIHRGEANATSKLTATQVRSIRRRVASGEPQIAVAKEYGVHKTNVQCICARKTWKHVS